MRRKPDHRADSLGPGERSAIGKALELGTILLADDLTARRHAQSLGLAIIGSLGVLVRAKHANLLSSVAPLVDELRSTGYWLSEVAVHAARTAANERDV
ncbi:MAG: DUF3368 domain-containing protein [Casimicrobiaceae bacterium]